MTLVPASGRTVAAVTSVTSTDGSITVTNPTGPVVNLAGVKGLPTGWTEDNSNPANVSSNSGSLNLADGGLAANNVVADGNISQFLGILTTPQTSGSLSTTTFVSGTGHALTVWDSDVTLYVPWTTDATLNVATLKVELSPDNTTYSTLTTLSVAAALNTIGALTQLLTLQVPHGWFVKLTAVHCTIGTCTGIGVPD